MTARARGDIFRKNAESDEYVRFAEAFPEIAELSVDVDERGEGNEELGLRRFHQGTVREFFNCSNHRCVGRGFRMGDLLRDMTRRRDTRRDVEVRCQSREESGGVCANIFRVSVRIAYRPSSPAAGSSGSGPLRN